MAADAERWGWRWIVAAVDADGEVRLLDPRRARKGRQICVDREAVIENQVVTMQADWTDGDPGVTEMMNILGSKQVPVVAIFPAGSPNRPIVFRGGYTKNQIIDALEKAGPGAASGAARTAMRPG